MPEEGHPHPQEEKVAHGRLHHVPKRLRARMPKCGNTLGRKSGKIGKNVGIIRGMDRNHRYCWAKQRGHSIT